MIRNNVFRVAATWAAVLIALSGLTGCLGRRHPGPPTNPQGQLRGRVVNEVQMVGVPGIHVTLLLQGRSLQTEVTNEDGTFTFRFRDIPEGALKIEVVDPSDQWETPGPMAVRNDFRVRPDFTVADVLVGDLGTRFTGRVVYQNGEVEVPIARAVVALVGTSDKTRTNGKGEFELRSRNMVEGISSYVLTVFAGQDFRPKVVTLPARFRFGGSNMIGTVSLTPLVGIIDPVTHIDPGYAPPWRGSGEIGQDL